MVVTLQDDKSSCIGFCSLYTKPIYERCRINTKPVRVNLSTDNSGYPNECIFLSPRIQITFDRCLRPFL